MTPEPADRRCTDTSIARLPWAIQNHGVPTGRRTLPSDVRDQHRRQTQAIRTIPARPQVRGEKLRQPRLDRLEVAIADVHGGTPEAQKATQGRVRIRGRPIEVRGQYGQEGEEAGAKLRRVHRGELLVVDRRHTRPQGEGPLHGPSDASLADDHHDLAADQRPHMPVQGGLGHIRKCVPELRRGDLAATELLDDAPPHRMQHDIGDAGLTVCFSGSQRLMTGRSELHIPTRAIVSAHVAPGWTSEILGIRSGLSISGLRKLGVFTHPSGARRLVDMRRGMPLLRIVTDREMTGFDELLLSTPVAAQLASAVQEVTR